MIASLREDNFDRLYERGSALAGSPDEIAKMLLDYHATCGGFDIASIQFYFSDIDPELARSSLELFATRVMPKLGQVSPGNRAGG